MHTVHNITFEVDVDHDGQHMPWEDYYVDFFRDRLLPKLERLCDKWDAKYPNKKCAIDEIDVDIDIDNINLEELQEKIITKIEDKLSIINENGMTTNGSVRATITSLGSPFEALIIYLQDGILPSYISVKIFKEWLGNVIQFTASEKERLATLFGENSLAIERMLSLLQNDYEKFAEIVETNQKITKQYIKLEASFFKKFVKTICEKAKLNYQETQAEIWFKTLGLSSSLAQFSKTFIQLLEPKAISEQKRLANTNAHYLSVAMLQAIVQNDMQKTIDISIAKIFDIITIITSESETTETSIHTKENTLKKNTEDVQNKVDSTTHTTQKSTSDKTENTTKSSQESETSQKADQIETNTQKSEVASTKNKEQQSADDHTINEISKQKNQDSHASSEIEAADNTLHKEETHHLEKNNESTIQSSEKENQKNIDKQAVHTNKHSADGEQTSANAIEGESTKNAKKSGNTIDSTKEENQTTQQNSHKTNQEATANTANKEVDNRIFERLSKHNAPVREIPLTTEKAGLILLNPFLVRFFTGAKLVNENHEIADFGKACMLLHYLATGTEEVSDVELTLEKICLGIPLDTIINYQTPLTEEDKALCEELLQAVIQHWSVLKNSSSNTLRDMFLKREGNITLKEDSIKLVVERFAQDILLDKVPWSIGLFQLKWMDKRMHIEW